MKQNVGKLDRIIRVVIGIAIISWGYLAQNWLGLIGLLPIATAIIGWCPAYCPIGLSTKGKGCDACCSK